jgi:outer membrane receptor protein involved in Fe transport
VHHQYGGRMALTWLPMDGLNVNFNALLYRLESDDNAWTSPTFTAASPSSSVLPRYNINLYVHNLTNKLVYLQANPKTNAVTGTSVLEAIPLQPRTLGISFDMKF